MKILHTFSKGAALLAVMAMVACDPQMNDKPEIGPTPTAEQVIIAATMQGSGNHVKFVDNTPGSFNSIWDLGNGQTVSGKEVVGVYPTKGEYTVKLTVLTKGGQATSTKKITIAKTDPTLLDIPAYNMLTGGVNQVGGKTWVVASFMKAHLGVGPAAGETPEWWSAGPNDKEGMDFYDDEMTFALDGFGFQYKNNGKSFTNASVMGTKEDIVVDYTPPTGMTWSMTEKDGKWFLSVSDAFIAYNVGTKKYQVLEISENLIHLKLLETKDGNAWYLKLVPKGFKPELPPVVVKPYEVHDIFEGFDEDGVMIKSWVKQMGDGSFDEFYDNPDPAVPNLSAKVARYRRGTGEQYANVQALLPYEMDLTARNKFTIKVFVPGSNKLAADKMTVALKLQNADVGDPWNSQHEVKLPITKFNEWVEYTFDFSDSKDRKDFDKIVLQLGGENHFEGGTFYVDDLKLL